MKDNQIYSSSKEEEKYEFKGLKEDNMVSQRAMLNQKSKSPDNAKYLNSSKKRIEALNDDHNRTDLDSSQNMNLISSKKYTEYLSDSDIDKKRQNNPQKRKMQLSAFDQNLILNNSQQLDQTIIDDQEKQSKRRMMMAAAAVGATDSPKSVKVNILNSESNTGSNHGNVSRKAQNNELLHPSRKGINSFIDNQQKLGGNQLQNVVAAKSRMSSKKSVFLKKEFYSNIDRISQRFLTFFYQKTVSGRTRHLSDKVRERFEDKSDIVKSIKKKHFILKVADLVCINIKKTLEKIKIPLFNPEQKWRIYFNSLIVIFNCFYLYIISLTIAFNKDEPTELQQFIHEIAQVVWIADMIIQMNTAMYHDNEFTEDRRIIMKIFVKEYFFFEVLPIIFESLTSDNIYISMLYHLPLLLKMKGIMIMLNNLEFYILQMLDHHSIFQLFKLIMKMLLFGHLLACCKNVVVQYEVFLTEQSIWSFDLSYYNKEDQLINYLQCMYWAFTVMLNVQQPTPSTKLELIFTSFCMILSSIAFGYILSAISNILSRLTKSSEDFNKDLNTLNQYMKRKKIEIGIKRRANVSLQKFYKQQRRTKIAEERNTLEKVDKKMLKELLVSSNQKILKYCPFLTHVFTESTLEQICMSLEEVFYSPQEIIIDNEGKNTEKYLYLVIEGKVCENYERLINQSKNLNQCQIQQRLMGKYLDLSKLIKNTPITNYHGVVIQKGDYFGLQGFILDKNLIQRAQSLEYSTILRISRNELERIISTNQKDKEIFMEVRDRLLYNNDVNDLYVQCEYCQSKQHFAQECFLLHFDRKNQISYLQSNFSPQQIRQPTKSPRKMKPFQALKNHKFILENIEELKSNYGMDSTRQFEESDVNVLDESEILEDKKIYYKHKTSLSEKQVYSVKEQDDVNEEDLTVTWNDDLNDGLDQSKEENSQVKKKQKKQTKNFKNDNKVEKLKSIKESRYTKQINNTEDGSQFSPKHQQHFYNQSLAEIENYSKANSQIITQNDHLKQSHQSFYNIKANDMTISAIQQLQPCQQQISRQRTKSLVNVRDEELISFDHVEDEYISRKSIQKMPSVLQQKGHGIYFQESQQDKMHSLTSSFNIQRIPTLENIIKKQQAAQSYIQGATTKKYLAQQNTMNSSQAQKKKQSLQNSQSISQYNSSLQPTISVKETRSNNVLGSKKDVLRQMSRMKSKVNTNSNTQTNTKNEIELKIIQSGGPYHLEEYETQLEGMSENPQKPQQQRQMNQDKLFYWYFDKMQNFQFYYWNYNFDNQIKKFDNYLLQKKNRNKTKTILSTKRDKSSHK